MQPLYFLITTAGTDTNSICYEVHQKALDIQAGRKIDPTFYSVIYGAGEDEDWTDPKVWKKANPSLGITVGIDKVRAACLSHSRIPAKRTSFRQLRLNQWVKQSVRWMPMEKWDACAFPIDEEAAGRPAPATAGSTSPARRTSQHSCLFSRLHEDDKYVTAVLLDTGGKYWNCGFGGSCSIRCLGAAGSSDDHRGKRSPLRLH